MLAELAVMNSIPYTNTASSVVSPPSPIGHEPNCEVAAFFKFIPETFIKMHHLFVIPAPDKSLVIS